MVARTTYFSKKVTLLNVVATFLVVLLHSETPLRFGQPFDLQSYPFIYSVFCLAQVAVPLFFFISAILFYRNCDWKDIPKKLYKRIFSLLIPFLLWNLIFCVIYYLAAVIPFLAARVNPIVPLDTAKDWLLAIWRTDLTPLWFVKYLIIYCLASPIILLVVKNKWVGLSAIVGLMIACVLLKWSYFDLPYWLPIYLSGAWAGRHLYGNGQNEMMPVMKTSTSFAILSLIVFTAFVVLITFDRIPWLWYEFFGPILIWFGVDAIKPELIRDKFNVKAWMGDMFFIFATHYFVLNIEQAAIRSILPPTRLVLDVTFIITPVVAVVFLLLVARLFSRFKFFKVLTGGR